MKSWPITIGKEEPVLTVKRISAINQVTTKKGLLSLIRQKFFFNSLDWSKYYKTYADSILQEQSSRFYRIFPKYFEQSKVLEMSTPVHPLRSILDAYRVVSIKFIDGPSRIGENRVEMVVNTLDWCYKKSSKPSHFEIIKSLQIEGVVKIEMTEVFGELEEKAV